MLVLNCAVMSRIINKVKKSCILWCSILNQCVEHILLNGNNTQIIQIIFTLNHLSTVVLLHCAACSDLYLTDCLNSYNFPLSRIIGTYT